MLLGEPGKTAKVFVLYTEQERKRRDASVWTLVQGILAPIQFFVFLISLGLILYFLTTGNAQVSAEVSVVLKTLTLYAIMITGSIWEKHVFGCYLFARPFFWEDVFSILVLALHSAYLVALFTNSLTPTALMWLALAAYATYVINAGQFVWKLRLARLDQTSRENASVSENASATGRLQVAGSVQ